MNKIFKKTSMTFETCLVFMLYVDYGFNNNKHILHNVSIFVIVHDDKSIKNMRSIHLRYI